MKNDLFVVLLGSNYIYACQKNIMCQHVTGSDDPNLLLKIKLVSVELVARPTHLKHVNFLVDADCAIASDP